MVNVAPEHCPRCGAPVTARDPPTVYHCAACDDYVFHNPAPGARAVVVDGDRLLLVEMTPESRVAGPEGYDGGEWILPGGHVEIGEQPDEAAARELLEETGLRVDPGDLALFDAVVRTVIPGAHGLNLLYAAPAAATEGALDAGSDAMAARFWHPRELGGEHVFRDMHDEPDGYGDPGWLLGRARAALEERGG